MVPQRSCFFKFVVIIAIFLALIFEVGFSYGRDKNIISPVLKKAYYYLDEICYDSAAHYFSRFLSMDGCIEEKTRFNVINNYVTCLLRMEEYDMARNLTLENISNILSSSEYIQPELADAYKNMGIFCFLTGLSGNADAYFIKALDITNRISGMYSPQSADIYEWLGIYHNGFSDSLSARKFLWRAMRIRARNHQLDNFSSGNLYRYMGLFYKRFGKLDSALFCFRKAKSLFDDRYTESNYESVKCLNNIGDVYEAIGSPDSSMAVYEHCLYLICNNSCISRYVLMMTYFNMAELLGSQGDYTGAVRLMQKILALYFEEFDQDCIGCNPENPGSIPSTVIKVIMAYKAHFYREEYKRDTIRNVEFLFYASDSYRLLLEIIGERRFEIYNIEDLIFYEHLNNNTILGIARNALYMYEIIGDTNYLSCALTYLSATKNTDLIFNDSENRKELESCFSMAHLRTKDSIKYKLNELLVLRNAGAKNEPTNPDNIAIAEMKIELDRVSYDVFNENRELLESIIKTEWIAVNDLKNKLEDDQVLVWFHEYSSDYVKIPYSVLVIAIDRDGIDYVHIEGKSLVSSILELQNLYLTDHLNTEVIDSIGYLIYSSIFPHLENVLPGNELIIIPSQHLSLVPFDALPTETYRHPKRMIDEHLIWNCFSVKSFLNKSHYSPHAEPNVLAFAPHFNGVQKETLAMLTKRDTGLINLPGALTECKNIAGLFNTKLLTGSQATREAFEIYSPDYDVVHLSTHGIPNLDNASNIRLVFSDFEYSRDEGAIDLFGILNIPLKANIVVLSACKTGIGEMSKGEGNINMAWAFNKAGARSVLVSIWDANDYASSVIMSAFYEYLYTGMAKADALRQAKLDFINSGDEIANAPFFWAGYQYWGDNLPIIHGKGNNNLFMFILLMVFVFIAVLFIKVSYTRLR
jgi:CHAT domain-containing protein